jgi:hypothetical protein
MCGPTGVADSAESAIEFRIVRCRSKSAFKVSELSSFLGDEEFFATLCYKCHAG